MIFTMLSPIIGYTNINCCLFLTPKAYIYGMKKGSLFLMSVLYVGAGVNHFLNPEMYLRIMPPWLQWHNELIAISGVCELCFGLLLLFPSTRRIAAVGIILLLIAVFPANIQMMLNYWKETNPNLWVSIIRLPLQIILIWWAYSFTKNSKLKPKEGNKQ